MSPRRHSLPILLALVLMRSRHGDAPSQSSRKMTRGCWRVKAAEAARFQANVDADAKVLGQVLADDLEYVHSNGELDSKQAFIDR